VRYDKGEGSAYECGIFAICHNIFRWSSVDRSWISREYSVACNFKLVLESLGLVACKGLRINMERIARNETIEEETYSFGEPYRH
jgi:hypothetical protein